MGWVLYVASWLAAALFWSAAGASSSGRSPLETLPFGLVAMATAATMGLGVWRLTRRLTWEGGRARFVVLHALALAAFSSVYATSWMWLDVVRGRLDAGAVLSRSSPVLLWNLLMGCWLYLVVAGCSYAVHAERRARASERAVREAQLLAQQAQLAALRARINPHFLYNALHSVGALVTHDPRRADQALERLGDLLRYALDAEDEVPFRREWAFTKDYLAFEQLRLADRLRLECDIDPGTSTVLVPPLVLQPLVENAVRHGLADRAEGGRIAVRARIEGNELVLTVDDDGAGAAAADGNGIGVHSVRERLRVLYGPGASVEAGRRPHGFGVTLRLLVRGRREEQAA
ncbi:MAG TPA: histidine kinase [Myxococcaceae bacterium]|nr:histidine kinase [Myxococcaceae bacterium]